MRWSEEVELLVEEMRRIKAFFLWDATRWDERKTKVCIGDAENLEGFRAYASRQAWIRRALHNRCADSWKDVPKFLALGEKALKGDDSLDIAKAVGDEGEVIIDSD